MQKEFRHFPPKFNKVSEGLKKIFKFLQVQIYTKGKQSTKMLLEASEKNPFCTYMTKVTLKWIWALRNNSWKLYLIWHEGITKENRTQGKQEMSLCATLLLMYNCFTWLRDTHLSAENPHDATEVLNKTREMGLNLKQLLNACKAFHWTRFCSAA